MVETLVEIKNSTVHAQIVDQIMAANLADTEQSWILDSDGTYHRGSIKNPKSKFLSSKNAPAGTTKISQKSIFQLPNSPCGHDVKSTRQRGGGGK